MTLTINVTRLRRTRISAALTVSAAVIAVVCTACGGSSSPGESTSATLAPAQQWTPTTDTSAGSTPTVPAPAPGPAASSTLPAGAPPVDRHSPESVARAALTIWFTWDTRTDSGPNDAAARTGPLLRASYADTLSQSGSVGPGAQWQEWSAEQAVLKPTISSLSDAGAPNTAAAHFYQAVVTQTPYSPSGSPLGAPVLNEVAVIVRHGDVGWEVTSIQPLS